MTKPNRMTDMRGPDIISRAHDDRLHAVWVCGRVAVRVAVIDASEKLEWNKGFLRAVQTYKPTNRPVLSVKQWNIMKAGDVDSYVEDVKAAKIIIEQINQEMTLASPPEGEA